jgi:hypothetical protein
MIKLKERKKNTIKYGNLLKRRAARLDSTTGTISKEFLV